jgi:hypothetical protein
VVEKAPVDATPTTLRGGQEALSDEDVTHPTQGLSEVVLTNAVGLEVEVTMTPVGIVGTQDATMEMVNTR